VIAAAGLLERERELEALRSAVSQTGRGDGALVLVQGAAGTGKSRLLEVAGELAQTAGLHPAAARGSSLEADFAFGIAVALLEPMVRDLSRSERRATFTGAATLSASLFDDPAAAEASSGAHGVHSLFHGLYWLAARLAARTGGLAVLVDDAHWCDHASLQWLAYLGRRLPGLPIAVVLASREDPEETAAAAWRELASNPLAVPVRPGPLSDEAVATLVRARLAPEADPEFCLACAHVTAGNPFLTHALLTELEAEGLAPFAANADRLERLAPEAVLQTVVTRLARLPRGSIELARAAAVLGDETPLRHCATVARLELPVAERAADALARAGILRSGSMLTYEHPLIRSAIETEIPAFALARAHLDAAQVLHGERAATELIAAHLLAAASGGGEAWAVAVLREAARRALARGEPQIGSGFLDRALQEPPRPELLGAVLVELGRAQAAAADPAAVETLERALMHVEDPTDRTALYRLLGDLFVARGEPHPAVEAYDRGIAELGENELGARELRAARAVVQTLSPGGVGEALAHAAVIAAHRGETPGERALLAQLAAHKTLTGAPRDEVRTLALRAWRDGQLLLDEGPDGQLWSLVTGALTWSDWHRHAVEIFDAVLAEAQRQGSVLAFATASYCRGGVQYRRGQIDDAITDLELALAAREDGWGSYIGAALSLLALCLAARGDVTVGTDALPSLEDPRWAQTVERLTVLEGRAGFSLATGHNQTALKEYVALGELCEGPFAITCPVLFPWHSGAALAALRLGDTGRARELLDAGMPIAQRVGAPSAIGRLRWIEGLLEGGEPGLGLMREAVELLDRHEPTLEHLRALVELGAALRRANRRAEAREPLQRARELATLQGATALASRATSELRATGARPRRIMLTGADALTGSERRVAELAATGRSNREIAEMLFVTVKAVEFHLGNAYRKLDVKGRRELADALAGTSSTTPAAAR
jgi:DNA-binding CsgD family transcriptional regulator